MNLVDKYKALLATSAFAQGTASSGLDFDIAYPPNLSSVTAGVKMIVDLERPSSDGIDGRVRFTLIPENASDGVVIHGGVFQPQKQPDNQPTKKSYHITVPADTTIGTATLSVKHYASLQIGEQHKYASQTKNITLQILKPSKPHNSGH